MRFYENLCRFSVERTLYVEQDSIMKVHKPSSRKLTFCCCLLAIVTVNPSCGGISMFTKFRIVTENKERVVRWCQHNLLTGNKKAKI